MLEESLELLEAKVASLEMMGGNNDGANNIDSSGKTEDSTDVGEFTIRPPPSTAIAIASSDEAAAALVTPPKSAADEAKSNEEEKDRKLRKRQDEIVLQLVSEMNRLIDLHTMPSGETADDFEEDECSCHSTTHVAAETEREKGVDENDEDEDEDSGEDDIAHEAAELAMFDDEEAAILAELNLRCSTHTVVVEDQLANAIHDGTIHDDTGRENENGNNPSASSSDDDGNAKDDLYERAKSDGALISTKLFKKDCDEAAGNNNNKSSSEDDDEDEDEHDDEENEEHHHPSRNENKDIPPISVMRVIDTSLLEELVTKILTEEKSSSKKSHKKKSSSSKSKSKQKAKKAKAKKVAAAKASKPKSVLYQLTCKKCIGQNFVGSTREDLKEKVKENYGVIWQVVQTAYGKGGGPLVQEGGSEHEHSLSFRSSAFAHHIAKHCRKCDSQEDVYNWCVRNVKVERISKMAPPKEQKRDSI